MKLNTDGLFVGNPGVVGCGGVVEMIVANGWQDLPGVSG